MTATTTAPRKATSLGRIIATARTRPDGEASASDARWRAVRVDDGSVIVFHYRTHMITVAPDDTVTGESRGWGSMTDKCGIRAIMRGIGSPEGYASIFG